MSGGVLISHPKQKPAVNNFRLRAVALALRRPRLQKTFQQTLAEPQPGGAARKLEDFLGIPAGGLFQAG
jgi:hypothetical protein